MALIKTTEAAARLGVSRQTIENWGKRGILPIKIIGGQYNSHFVEESSVDALIDVVIDHEKAKRELEAETLEIKKKTKELNNSILELRRQVMLVNKFGQITLAREFYLSLVNMMQTVGVINHREGCIMKRIIEGDRVLTLDKSLEYQAQGSCRSLPKDVRRHRNCVALRRSLMLWKV